MEINQQFGDDVTRKCFDVYEKLGKKGKPQVGREWTKMSCIVQTDDANGNMRVISLATGTKCIGRNQRTKNGYVINDSHAEILARRLFLKYCYQQLITASRDDDNSAAGNESIFTRCSDDERNKFNVKDGIKFHLFSTDVPCGDSSIFPKKTFEPPASSLKTNQRTLKRPHDEADSNETNTKKSRQANNGKDPTHLSNTLSENPTDEETQVGEQTSIKDIHRTGAKCVPSGQQDLLENGENYHVTGALRVKPGRGDRTSSLSCSDKIMKWCVLGLQGGLLSNFLKQPVFLHSIVISHGAFDKPAMLRALSLRVDLKDGINTGRRAAYNELIKGVFTPEVFQSQLKFSDSKESVMANCDETSGSITPSGSSILSCTALNLHEVSANGRKLGITKKDIHTPKSRCCVCKSELFEDFKRCQKAINKTSSFQTYHYHKHSSLEYESKRKMFFQCFPNWILKPATDEEFE